MPKISDEARGIYLERRVDELRKCVAALKSEDWDLIRRVGHKVKGNAETFGFERLTPIAISLELAAKAKSAAAVQAALSQLEKELAALTGASC